MLKQTGKKDAEAIKNALLKSAPEAYLVGGSVRDVLLGRPVLDLDICTGRDSSAKAARTAAKACGGAAILLDEETATWRVAAKHPFAFQLDISPFQGKDEPADIARRDFTVNSLSVPLNKVALDFGKDSLIVSFDRKTVRDRGKGLKDLKAGIVRMNAAAVLKADPLRLLRAFRTAAELGFKIEPATLKAIKANAGRAAAPSGERIREELRRILGAPKASQWISLMDKTGILCAIFPELKAQRTCAIRYYGRGGVLKHTLSVVERLEYFIDNSGSLYPEFKEGLSVLAGIRASLLLTALLHDIAKPKTAQMREGRLRFFMHEEEGAAMSGAVLERLKYSRAETRLVTHIIKEHLRPGNLSANSTISERAVYRFFRDMGPEAVPLLALCWADYASYVTPGVLTGLLKKGHRPPPEKIDFQFSKNSPAKTLRHLQVVYLLLEAGFLRRDEVEPQKLVNGKDVIKTLKLEPSPRIGEILEEVRARQAEGKIKNREQALRWIASLKRGKK